MSFRLTWQGLVYQETGTGVVRHDPESSRTTKSPAGEKSLSAGPEKEQAGLIRLDRFGLASVVYR